MKEFLKYMFEIHGIFSTIMFALTFITAIVGVLTFQLGLMVLAQVFGTIGLIASIIRSLK